MTATRRAWPTREQWAAAEHSVRSFCLPLERVPAGHEHYLTPQELERRQQIDGGPIVTYHHEPGKAASQ